MKINMHCKNLEFQPDCGCNFCEKYRSRRLEKWIVFGGVALFIIIMGIIKIYFQLEFNLIMMGVQL
jgi:hypothetical protein